MTILRVSIDRLFWVLRRIGNIPAMQRASIKSYYMKGREIEDAVYLKLFFKLLILERGQIIRMQKN